MSENIKIEDITEEVTPTSEVTEEVPEVEADPLKIELNKVQGKEKRSELDKAAFSLQKNAERLAELGGDPRAILGIEDEDDTPLTMGMFKKMRAVETGQSALQKADAITSESERELVKYHLQNTIKSTNDPDNDLRIARAIVNDLKNKQVIEEISRKTPPKTYSNSSSVDAKQVKNPQFTADELSMMQAPFNMSQQEVLDARSGNKYKFQNSK